MQLTCKRRMERWILQGVDNQGEDTTQRQGWFKVVWETTVEKYEDQYFRFEHAIVPNRHPVKSLMDGSL